MAFGADVRNRIDAVRASRSTAQEARQRQPEAAPGAIQVDRLKRVLGACRPMATLAANKRLEGNAVEVNGRLEQHLCNLAHGFSKKVGLGKQRCRKRKPCFPFERKRLAPPASRRRWLGRPSWRSRVRIRFGRLCRRWLRRGLGACFCRREIFPRRLQF